MYVPKPINTDDVKLSDDLVELTEELAKNTHEIWAQGRIKAGWTYGIKRDDAQKTTPCLVEYENLSEDEKSFDRNTSVETLKLVIKLGYSISKKK